MDSIAKIAELETAEKEKMKVIYKNFHTYILKNISAIIFHLICSQDKVDKILKYGCNVFINRQLIYNYPNYCLLMLELWLLSTQTLMVSKDYHLLLAAK